MIPDKEFLSRVKASVKPSSYLECGICGAIRGDAIEIASILYNLAHPDDEDDDFSDRASELLGQIIEPGPREFESHIAWEKWQAGNQHRICKFFAPECYETEMCVKYEEIVLRTKKSCNCFAKTKIQEIITI